MLDTENICVWDLEAMDLQNEVQLQDLVTMVGQLDELRWQSVGGSSLLDVRYVGTEVFRVINEKWMERNKEQISDNIVEEKPLVH